MEIQRALGADIAMAFDHVVPGQAPYDLAREGMERTLRWLERGRRRHAELDGAQTLWPIVQGGTHEELRLRSLEGTLERGPWTGIAIGGLSVGEPKPVMHRVRAWRERWDDNAGASAAREFSPDPRTREVTWRWGCTPLKPR